MEGNTENKKFGYIAAFLLLCFAVIKFWRLHKVNHIALAACIFLILLARFFPHYLNIPRRLMIFLSGKINLVTQPLLLGIVYFAVITPFGFLKRLLVKPSENPSNTYWIPSSELKNNWMKNQF
jgi:hypothetical protein